MPLTLKEEKSSSSSSPVLEVRGEGVEGASQEHGLKEER